MPNTREKLIELLNEAEEHSTDVCCFNSTCEDCPGRKYGTKCRYYLKADHLIANGVGLREQDCHWATEQTYKNGYKQGKADAMKWIPVTERLPEKDGKYQVYIDGHINKGIHHAYFAKDARKVDKFDFRCRWKNVWYGYDNEWGHYEVDAVTHWMPLPELPKGE